MVNCTSNRFELINLDVENNSKTKSIQHHPDPSLYSLVLNDTFSNRDVSLQRAFIDLNKKKERLERSFLHIESLNFNNKVYNFLNNVSLPANYCKDYILEIQDRFLFKQVVHTALKGYSHRETENLQHKYSRMDSHYQSFQATVKVATLLQNLIDSEKQIPGLTTQKEKESLLRIFQDRHNHLTYSRMLQNLASALASQKDNLSEELEMYLEKRILLLPMKDDPSVTLLENGSTCISIEGGWNQHYVGFQFIRDPQGQYYFCLENRDKFSQDLRFHGFISFSHKNKWYSKSRVLIKVELDSLLDMNFLSFIVNDANGYSSKSASYVYDYLYEHLLIRGRGEIVQTEIEKLLQPMALTSLHNRNDVLQTQVNQIFCNYLRPDHSYQSNLELATCTKSNALGREKDMASAPTRRILKCYEIGDLCCQLNRKYCFTLTNSIRGMVNYVLLYYHLTNFKNYFSEAFNSSIFLNRLHFFVNQWISCGKEIALAQDINRNTSLFNRILLVSKKIDIEIQIKNSLKELEEANILYKHSSIKLSKLLEKIFYPPAEKIPPPVSQLYNLKKIQEYVMINI